MDAGSNGHAAATLVGGADGKAGPHGHPARSRSGRHGAWPPDHRATLTGCRRVLFVVHTVAGATRLRLVAQLLANDPRVEVVFSRAPDELGGGVDRFLTDLGAAVLPWRDAAREPFDLAIAAGYGELHKLGAPVAVLPHGAGHNKLVPRQPGAGLPVARGVYGYDRERLVRNGRVVAASVVLSHVEQRAQLAAACPEALPAAVVVGDPCYDQITGSRAERAAYRQAMGVSGDQKLVVVTSTWGRQSLFARSQDLFPRLLGELPAGAYRVVAILHPNIEARHGRFQIHQVLHDCRERGLGLVPPDQDWQAALVAADWVIGDHGSVTLYAAAAGVPVLAAAHAAEDVAAGSPIAQLTAAAPRLRPDRPVQPQLHAAAAGSARERYAPVAQRVTSEPGAFARNMRGLIYRHLEIDPPVSQPRLPPLRPPDLTQR